MAMSLSKGPLPLAAISSITTGNKKVLNLPLMEFIFEGSPQVGCPADWASLLLPGQFETLVAEEVATAGEHWTLNNLMTDNTHNLLRYLLQKPKLQPFISLFSLTHDH